MHLVATPIGNLGDLSPRALAALRDADIVLCEDTRVTAKLLGLCGAGRPLQGYHEHNAARVRPQILERLRAGAAVALVSDAGTPLVSDPGYKLVRDAIAAEIEVFARARAVGGARRPARLRPADRPLLRRRVPADAALAAAARHRRARGRYRGRSSCSRRRAACRIRSPTSRPSWGRGPAAVARELTKRFEEVRRGSLAELAAHYGASRSAARRGRDRDRSRRRALPEQPSGAELDELLAAALESSSPAAAAAAVAAATGQPRRGLYRRALALQGR